MTGDFLYCLQCGKSVSVPGVCEECLNMTPPKSRSKFDSCELGQVGNITVTKEQFDHLNELLDLPPKPNPELKKLMTTENQYEPPQKSLADIAKAKYEEFYETHDPEWNLWEGISQAVAEAAVKQAKKDFDPFQHLALTDLQKIQLAKQKEVISTIPFPCISAGTADAIAYQLEIGKEAHSCPIADAAIAAWLRDMSKQLVAFERAKEIA